MLRPYGYIRLAPDAPAPCTLPNRSQNKLLDKHESLPIKPLLISFPCIKCLFTNFIAGDRQNFIYRRFTLQSLYNFLLTQ
jgi:hypothetical protein